MPRVERDSVLNFVLVVLVLFGSGNATRTRAKRTDFGGCYCTVDSSSVARTSLRGFWILAFMFHTGGVGVVVWFFVASRKSTRILPLLFMLLRGTWKYV